MPCTERKMEMNEDDISVERFVKAQNGVYEVALKEIRDGEKRSHWMWFIFPQVEGLGSSPTAQYYAIKSRKEAKEYLDHPVLGPRLIEISEALLRAKSNDAMKIMGFPDNLKLHSSMTLFYIISGNLVFKRVLDKFFEGELDEFTANFLS